MKMSLWRDRSLVPTLLDGELDLVCIHPEKGFNSSLAQLNFLIGAGAAFCFVLVVLVLVLWTSRIFASTYDVPDTLAVVLMSGALIGFASYVVLQFRTAFPTNLLCHDGGLSLAWRTDHNRESLPILWDSVAGASVRVQML